MKISKPFCWDSSEELAKERESLQIKTVQETASFFDELGFDSLALEDLMDELDSVD